jgi:uncharacterized membrane protein YfcA
VNPPDPGTLGLVFASSAVLVGSVVQGAVGFGLALVAAPILFLIDPRLVPGPMIFASLVLTLLTAYRDRHAIDASGLGWGLVGRLPGTLLGAALLALLPPERLAAPLGVLVLLGVVLSASGLHVAVNPRTLMGAGLLSGFMGTASSIGGPPIAMLYQHAPGSRLRGTLSAYFVIGGVMSLVAIAAVGRFGGAELLWGLWMVPGAVIGFAISSGLTPFLDRGFTRPAVLCVAAVAGLGVLARQLW